MNSVWNNQVMRALYHFHAFSADQLAHLGLEDLDRSLTRCVRDCGCEKKWYQVLTEENRVQVVNALRRLLRSPDYYCADIPKKELERIQNRTRTLLMLVDPQFIADSMAYTEDLPVPAAAN